MCFSLKSVTLYMLLQELEALQQGMAKLQARLDGQEATVKQHERRVLEVVQVSVGRACLATWPGHRQQA